MSPATTPWENDAAGGASSGGDVNRFPMPAPQCLLEGPESDPVPLGVLEGAGVAVPYVAAPSIDRPPAASTRASVSSIESTAMAGLIPVPSAGRAPVQIPTSGRASK